MSRDTSTFIGDFGQVGEILMTVIPTTIDGQQAILEMRDGGSRNWKQMEWVGFYLEFLVETRILPLVKGGPGPQYGNTKIDLMLSTPWDLKAHPIGQTSVILNDKEAVDLCIEEHGTISYFLLEGKASYDDDQQSFKNWHDSLKGKESKYVREGKATGRTSRRRKTNFIPTRFFGIELNQESLQHGAKIGAIKSFQEGMRNSNGNARRSKYQLVPSKIDQAICTTTLVLPGSDKADQNRG